MKKLLIIIAMVLLPCMAHAAPTLVQSTSTYPLAASKSATTTSNVTSGDIILVKYQDTASAASTKVGDPTFSTTNCQNISLTQISPNNFLQASTHSTNQWVYYGSVPTTGSCVIKITPGTSSGDPGFFVEEWSGVSSYATTSNNYNSPTTSWISSTTSALANSAVSAMVGEEQTAEASITWLAGWTSIQNQLGHVAMTAQQTFAVSSTSMTVNAKVPSLSIYSYQIIILNGAKSIINVPTNFLALNTGLVGWWTFDGRNTDWNKYLTYDLSGNFATGTINKALATSTAVVQGKDGQALLFKYGVSSSMVDISPATSSVATGDVTLSAWIKPSSTQTNSVIMHLGDTLSNNDVSFQYGNPGIGCGTGLNFLVYTTTGQCANAAGFSTIKVGVWYHLVGTFSAANGMVVYVNGVNTGTNINTVRGSTKSNHFQIGADSSGNGTTRSFDGVIDDVRVYNRALSVSEVLQLYDVTAGGRANTSLVGPGNLNSGLVGWWTFDGKNTDWSKNQTYDSSGQANTGTMTSMSTTSSPVAGKVGQALKITNTSQYISMGQVNVTHTGTVSVWYKYTLFTQNDLIMSNANFNTDRNGFVLAHGGAGIWFELDSATAKETFQTASKYNDNKWHLFTVAWDGNYVSFYVDGALAPMWLSANPIAQTLDAVSNVYNLQIAKDGSGGYHLHDGSIDDVRVYNRALSASEVLQLYDLGAINRI